MNKYASKTMASSIRPTRKWAIDGGFEAGTIEDDTRDLDAGFERSDFDRKAISMTVGYKDEEREINARIHRKAPFEESGDNTRNHNTYLLATGLSWKTLRELGGLANVDAVLSDSDSEESFRDDDCVDRSFGYAHRPVDKDRLNALFKYSGVYDLVHWLSVGANCGFRDGEVRKRVLDGDRGSFSERETSSAHLGITRTDLHIVKNSDGLLEGRVMHLPEAKTTDYCALVALYRHAGENFKIGAGYYTSAHSPMTSESFLDDEGVFLNTV